jgi:hypothetical protein
MRFRKVIDSPMQGNASCQISRERAGQGTFNPIPHNTAYNQGGIITGKQSMR